MYTKHANNDSNDNKLNFSNKLFKFSLQCLFVIVNRYLFIYLSISIQKLLNYKLKETNKIKPVN